MFHSSMSSPKAELREAIEKRLRALTEKDRRAESRSLCRRVIESIDTTLDAVCLYIPLKTEVDVEPLFAEFKSREVPIYLPRFASNALEFRRFEDRTKLVQGALNIPEPPSTSEVLPSHGKVLVLVPGRAFDKNGGRLGRGNGGYDRWIRSYRRANSEVHFLGVCFECQIVPEVPLEEHDERVDSIATAREMGS